MVAGSWFRSRQRFRAVCWAALTALLLASCGMPVPREAPRQEPGEGPGGRQQALALTPTQELTIGRRAYREVMEEYGDRLLPADDPEVVRTRNVMRRLVRAAAIEPLQREINLHVKGYRFEWEANVIQSREVNAFALPAGKLFLTTGILRVVDDQDDYLATVVSHEMAHALAHHASERLARQRSGESVFRSLAYDRQQESEADHIGAFLMPFAGYDPLRTPDFWRRMHSARGRNGEPPEFLSDHPSDDRRIRDLEKWARDALAAKRAYDQGDIAPARQRTAENP